MQKPSDCKPAMVQIALKTLSFKTNINCGGCVKSVTPFLNESAGEGHWRVDTAVPDKILTVEGEQLDAAQILASLEDAGFEAEEITLI